LLAYELQRNRQTLAWGFEMNTQGIDQLLQELNSLASRAAGQESAPAAGSIKSTVPNRKRPQPLRASMSTPLAQTCTMS
jgi:hypothetical protein